jgi:hypothetical protein
MEYAALAAISIGATSLGGYRESSIREGPLHRRMTREQS